jgi:hypothetical protein
MRRLLLATALLAACGGPDDADDGAADDAAPGGAPDAAPADAAPCAPADLTLPWLESYQREIVAKLAGATPIAPGVTLTDRATAPARDAVRDYLVAELTAHGLTPELFAYESGANVLARLPARTPGAPLVVLGAHFDGVPGSPAAADDGTGTAVVLGLARHLAAEPCRDREVVVVFFDQEELGLVGSGEYAVALARSGVTVEAVHAFYMITFDGDGDRAVELWSPSPPLLAAYQAAGAALGAPIQPVEFASSDHESFLAAGFPATGVSEEFVGGDSTAHYHTPMDTYETIDFAYLGAVTRLAVTVVDRQVLAPESRP